MIVSSARVIQKLVKISANLAEDKMHPLRNYPKISKNPNTYHIIEEAINKREITCQDAIHFSEEFYDQISQKDSNCFDLIAYNVLSIRQLGNCNQNQLDVLNELSYISIQQMIILKPDMTSFLEATDKTKEELRQLLEPHIHLILLLFESRSKDAEKKLKEICDGVGLPRVLELIFSLKKEKLKNHFTLQERNKLFSAFYQKTVTNKQFLGCFDLYGDFDVQLDSSEFIDNFGVIREDAFLQLKKEMQKIKNKAITEVQKNIDIVDLLEEARDMTIFNKHRNSHYLTGGFGRTTTVKEIDLLLEKYQGKKPVMTFTRLPFRI